MENINDIQLKILSKLLFSPNSRFKDLNTDSLSTDNFSYHIRALISEKLIVKEGSYYSLSKQGKIVAAKLDTDTHQFEKQPKIGVLVIPRKRESNKNWFLVQQRRKEPYFGYWGFMTGKVRWGETLAETVARELEEETGLSGDWKFCYELHEMVYDKNTNEMLEDKFFHIAEVRKVRGELQQTKDGFNKWVTIDEFKKMSPKYHNEDDILNWYLNKDFTFKEEKYYIERF